MHEKMKDSAPDTTKGERTQTEDPFFSLSHLASPEDGQNEYPGAHGFASPREDIFYETGILMRIFLKC